MLVASGHSASLSPVPPEDSESAAAEGGRAG